MPCDMDRIEAIADKYGLAIIEDAAHPRRFLQGRKIGADRESAEHPYSASTHEKHNDGRRRHDMHRR